MRDPKFEQNRPADPDHLKMADVLSDVSWSDDWCVEALVDHVVSHEKDKEECRKK